MTTEEKINSRSKPIAGCNRQPHLEVSMEPNPSAILDIPKTFREKNMVKV